jgi:hypothetical protein
MSCHREYFKKDALLAKQISFTSETGQRIILLRRRYLHLCMMQMSFSKYYNHFQTFMMKLKSYPSKEMI